MNEDEQEPESGLEVLEPEEYAAIKLALENAGITDLELIKKTVRKFEVAAIQTSVLNMLVEGIAKVVGITEDGSAKIGLISEDLEPSLPEDEGPTHEELMKYFGRS